MKRVQLRLFFGILIVSLFSPAILFAANDRTVDTSEKMCSTIFRQIDTMAKTMISGTSVEPGGKVEIPVMLTNKTRTPLGDLHLVVRVSRIVKDQRIVSLEYYPQSFALAPGASLTTNVLWKTTEREARGFYRMDVFVLPASDFPNSGIATDVTARAYTMIEVLGDNTVEPVDFDREKTVFNDHHYNPGYPPLFDEGEKGTLGIVVTNEGAKEKLVTVSMNFYPYQQIIKDALLAASTTKVVVPARGSVNLVYAIPAQQLRRYAGVAEIESSGQRDIYPVVFNRKMSTPPPIGIFGIESEDGVIGAFDIRAGKTYSLFACPLAVPTTTQSTLSLRVQKTNGKSLAFQQFENSADAQHDHFGFTFTSTLNSASSELVLENSVPGTTTRKVLMITCGNSIGGACIPLSLLEQWNISRTMFILIVLALLMLSYGAYRVIVKYIHHEEIIHN